MRFKTSPCVSLCGIPVVNQTSFGIMFRMFGLYSEKLPCGKLERKLMETEPKEAMRLIAAMKSLLDVEASSRKHFVTIRRLSVAETYGLRDAQNVHVGPQEMLSRAPRPHGRERGL